MDHLRMPGVGWNIDSVPWAKQQLVAVDVDNQISF